MSDDHPRTAHGFRDDARFSFAELHEAVKVKRCRSNLHAQPCWHGYCADCGKPLTAFDFTEDECRKIGEGTLHEHRCPRKRA